MGECMGTSGEFTSDTLPFSLLATPLSLDWDLPVLEKVPDVDLASLVVQPLLTSDDTVVEAVSAALLVLLHGAAHRKLTTGLYLRLSPTLMAAPSAIVTTVLDLMDTPPIGVLDNPGIPVMNSVTPLVPTESDSVVTTPAMAPPSSSSGSLSRGQGSAVWSAPLAARAEKEVCEKSKERDVRGSDASNYAALGMGIHVKGESAGAFRDQTVNNESTIVGALVKVKDELKHHTGEHAEQYDMTL